MTPDDLAAIAARAAAATPGPWEMGRVRHECDGDFVGLFCDECEVFPPLGESGPVCATSEGEHANAAFIAAARTDVPALLAHIATLTAERDAALSRAAAAEARGAEVRAEALREARAAVVAHQDAVDAEAERAGLLPSLYGRLITQDNVRVIDALAAADGAR